MAKQVDSVLPGWGLSLGVTLTFLSVLLLLPVSLLLLKVSELSSSEIMAIVSSKRSLAALWLSVRTAIQAAAVNVIFGTLIAWVLVRYRFFGRRVLDACVDLPFALPTAVAGITLTTLLSPKGLYGSYLSEWGIDGAYSPFGITVALVFVGLPFVVRSVQPVLEDMNLDLEFAAMSLGASRLQTWVKVVLPSIVPAMVTGFSLAFARALGEYGSVVFIAGNMPLRTEILPLLIMTRLEQFNYGAACVLAAMMLFVSLVILLGTKFLDGGIRTR
ncbi:MAG: sulfate ABC transporter permease subunit CysT [Bdellovibrionota bacterium]|nr:MAG: sulfate ABC transporter permease subunit CysT [Bdellovibrionota bacterium]